MNPSISLHHRFGGGFAILAAFLFVATIVVLGQAIGWPGILREPPSVVFPRIDANKTAMLFGYTCYLFSSLAMIPVAFALRERFIAAGINVALVDTITFFGAAGAILKTLGIVRWLSAMPLLASQYVATTSADTRALLETAYTALNGYAGSVGELLGVQLVSGVWMASVGMLMLRKMNRFWTGALGATAGVGFLMVTGRVFEPGLAALQAFINPIALLWVLVLGIEMLKKQKNG